MRTPDQTNAAPDVVFAHYGAGHLVPRQCDDTQHVGGRKVMQQMGGKVRFIAGKPAGWRCPVCVARREAARAEKSAAAA